MLSMHTNPVAQPGTGDAGGMNVYVSQLAAHLGRLGVTVDMVTRVPDSADTRVTDISNHVRLWEIPAGAPGLVKAELAAVVVPFAENALAALTANGGETIDIVHSHYWISGLAGLALATAAGAPLVHSMHTMGRVKNAYLAPGDKSEPAERLAGEAMIVQRAAALIVASAHEGEDIVNYYDGDAAKIYEVTPGVNHRVFHPEAGLGIAAKQQLRRGLGVAYDGALVLFAGRIQKLKAPDVLVEALAQLPSDTRLAVVGGPSGDPSVMRELHALVARLGLDARVSFHDPVPPARLADWFRAADVVAVPSYNESFGFVAAEAMACGTPVVGAAVGGLREIIDDGVSGFLVGGHEPALWADALRKALANPARRAELAMGAAQRGQRFSWDATARQTEQVYEAVLGERALAAQMS